jgi:hypothetical protein
MIKTYPVWSFPPNWDQEVGENLAWLTDIMLAATGSEQRRAMRVFPRREFEFSVAVTGTQRSFLSNMLASFANEVWYLPLWHDVSMLVSGVQVGATELPFAESEDTQLMAMGLAYLSQGDPFNFEIVEIESAGINGITLVNGVTKDWPTGTFVHPLTWGRLTDPVTLTKVASNTSRGEVRFMETRPGGSVITRRNQALLLSTTYLGFPVITDPSVESSPLTHGYESMVTEIDNKTSQPYVFDDAKRTFSVGKYNWLLTGRAKHNEFMATVEALRGRTRPFWLPTFMDDFELDIPAPQDSVIMQMSPCGFGAGGGAGGDREHILIETYSGVQLFRKITLSRLKGDGKELLTLDSPLPFTINPSDILRISFMALSRLNSDQISIVHRTDTVGVSEISMTIRSAPNTRFVESEI